VDGAAELLHVVDELLQVVIEALERGLLDRAGAIAQRFALGELVEGLRGDR
jgi:hypothetical protein